MGVRCTVPYRALRFACYYGYFAIGFILTIVGPLVPAMREELSLTLGQVAPLFFVQGGGFSLGVLLGGTAADRLGRRPVLVAGAGILAATFTLFLFGPGWWQTLLLFFFAAVGFGLCEGAINSIAVDLAGDDAGRSLNILHFFPAAGAVAAPFCANLLLPYGWRAPLVLLGLLFLLFLVWVIAVEAPPRRALAHSDAGETQRSLREVALHPLLLLAALLLALYVGVENTMSGWSASYLIEVLGSTTALGGWVTSLFWVGLMAGRSACSLIAAKVGYLRLLVWTGVGASLAYLPLALVQTPAQAAGLTFLSGAFLGGVFPTVVAYVGTLFPDRVGSAFGLISAACAVGGAAIPALVGALSDRWGMRTGLLLGLLALVAMVAVTQATRRITARSHRIEEITPGGISQ